MKKILVILLIVLGAYFLGISDDAGAEPWRFKVLCDSCNAARDTILYFATGDYSKAFIGFLWGKMAMTGATNGAFASSVVYQAKSGTGYDVYTEAIYTKLNGQAWADSTGPGNNDFYAFTAMQSPYQADGELNPVTFIIPGDSVKVEYSANDVTGGWFSVGFHYQVQE